MPLLCQQIQLLADHRGSQAGVCVFTKPGDPEGGPGALQSQSLSGLQQTAVGIAMGGHDNTFRKKTVGDAGERDLVTEKNKPPPYKQ